MLVLFNKLNIFQIRIIKQIDKKIAYDIGVFITLTQGQSGKVKNRKNAKFISFYVEKK